MPSGTYTRKPDHHLAARTTGDYFDPGHYYGWSQVPEHARRSELATSGPVWSKMGVKGFQGGGGDAVRIATAQRRSWGLGVDETRIALDQLHLWKRWDDGEFDFPEEDSDWSGEPTWSGDVAPMRPTIRGTWNEWGDYAEECTRWEPEPAEAPLDLVVELRSLIPESEWDAVVGLWDEGYSAAEITEACEWPLAHVVRVLDTHDRRPFWPYIHP